MIRALTITTAAFWLGVFLAGVVLLGPLFAEEEDCFTDSCVFAMCERELKRPCTDEDVFGPPVESDCADLPPDHPDYCTEEDVP